MPAALVAFVFREDGELAMTIIPDRDSELDQAAFNLPGTVQVRATRDEVAEANPDLFAKGGVFLDKELWEERLISRVVTKDVQIAARMAARVAERKAEKEAREAEAVDDADVTKGR